MRYVIKLTIVFSFIVFRSSLFAEILNVPADYSTIQAGLNAADSSDTVLVQPSTYYENIFWPNVNGIKLISTGDSSNTIIDGSNSTFVIYIYGAVNIDTTTVIFGFTIRNGMAESGGGITCNNASPLIRNCIISSNGGGGLAFTNSSPVLRNNMITNNAGSGISYSSSSGKVVS